MSEPGDYYDEDLAYDEYLRQSEQAIAEFAQGRLQSFFLAFPLVAQPPRVFAAKAESLLTIDPTAAHLMAAVSCEVAVKGVYLRGIVHGLVHSEPAATLISDLALRTTRMDLLKSPFFTLLRDFGNVDFANLTRPKQGAIVWSEIQHIQKKRDHIVHRAELATAAEAEQAIGVSIYLLDSIFPRLISHLGLHVHSDHRVCESPFCESEPEVKLLASRLGIDTGSPLLPRTAP